MKKFECDRCGKLMKEPYTKYGDDAPYVNVLHFCEECSNDFDKWLEGDSQ